MAQRSRRALPPRLDTYRRQIQLIPLHQVEEPPVPADRNLQVDSFYTTRASLVLLQNNLQNRQEMMLKDQNDATTNRGRKLQKERQTAKCILKTQIIISVLVIGVFCFLVSITHRNTSSDTLTPLTIDVAHCTLKFDLFLGIYCGLMILSSVYRILLYCRLIKSDVKRREVKVFKRKSTIVLNLLLISSIFCISYSTYD